MTGIQVYEMFVVNSGRKSLLPVVPLGADMSFLFTGTTWAAREVSEPGASTRRRASSTRGVSSHTNRLSRGRKDGPWKDNVERSWLDHDFRWRGLVDTAHAGSRG